jgi:hypothetical protein
VFLRRELEVGKGVSFLGHPDSARASIPEKQRFLMERGLTAEEAVEVVAIHFPAIVPVVLFEHASSLLAFCRHSDELA